LHVAAANYNLPHLIGTAPPEGFQAKGFDKSTTDKAKVIAASTASKSQTAPWESASLATIPKTFCCELDRA
jgi:hypothetical protein